MTGLPLAAQAPGDKEQRILWAHKRWLGLICVAFVVLAWTYGLVLPPFENLDEIEHFSAIRYVAETGSLPVHDPAIQEQYHYRQEASQPPLYYMLMGGLTRLLGLPTDDTNSYLVSNPFVACGPSDNPYNKHILYHNPSREAFSLDKLGASPWDGALLTLRILRALTPLLQVVTIIGGYAIARLVFPQHPQVGLLAAALTAFNPQFLFVASGVNNDNLVTPLATAGVYLTLTTRQHGLSRGRSVGLGLLAGLAGLSKLSGLLLLALVGLILLEMAWRSRPHPFGKIIAHGLLIASAAAAICGWWFWRNWQLYGDATALEPMLEWVGQRETFTLPLNESGLMFRSFWGQLACTFFSDRFYVFFGLLTAAGLIGLLIAGLKSWQKGWEDRKSWESMLWLALWFGIIFAGWLRWGSITPATGGRLLFPAIVSTSALIAYGLVRLWPAGWRAWVQVGAVILLAMVAVATLLWELRPLFAPPRTFEGAYVPSISHPLEATFGFDSQIGFRGYDVKNIDDTLSFDVTLYWEALTPIPQDYALAIQLTSPVPGDDSLRFNYNTWPGRGNYPTTAWQPGQVIADHYRFKLPASDESTQAWQLLVAFYDVESGERLPVRLNDQVVDAGLILRNLRVPGIPLTCPQEATLLKPILFGQAERKLISMSHAVISPSITGTNPGINVVLCWKGLALIPLDYTVFVHLYDEKGELLATGDGQPMHGAFPTQLWQPDDRVLDLHFVSLADVSLPTADNYRIGVGWYDLESGTRLQATQFDQPVPNNIVLLQP